MTKKFMRWPKFKEKALTLSYDDGVIYDKKLIEIMQKNGLRGTFNINSGWFTEHTGDRRMKKEEAYKLYTESNNEVAVHGVRHMPLDAINEACAVNDVINDRLALEETFGTIIQGMAYAYGTYTDGVVELLKKCGIKYARTVSSTERFDIPTDWLRMPATCHHRNPRLMELARQFVEDKGNRSFHSHAPKLFYLWGHSYEFNDNDNWNVIEEFAEYVGNRDDIWYATNIEIYDYVKAFDSLEYSASGRLIHNPTATDVYISYVDREYVIRAGETVEVIPMNHK